VNTALRQFLTRALRASLRDPALAGFLLRTYFRQFRARWVRSRGERAGLQVPPYLIASVTSRCNLRCQGCYANAHHRGSGLELTTSEWRRVLTEAEELGVSVVVMAGGEPLTRPDLLELTRDHPRMLFPVFTNGLLIDEPIVRELRRQRQVIPVLSLEGFEKETDSRRGLGVYTRLQATIDLLNRHRIFYGVSVTVTRDNFALVTGDDFVKAVMATGCRIVFYVEYVPIEEGTAELAPDREQRERLDRLELEFYARFNGLFIAFPGDEEMFDGCLAAGRGFVHIGPDGALEPCPFAPYSDCSVRDRPLRDALQSKLLREIRQNHRQLSETRGGCALWQNREWVRSLVQSGPAVTSLDP
jgi:MoaA/NifB/PqqE/SkfB family radical SAM enzyme